MELLTYPSEDVLEKASEAVNAMLERNFGTPMLFLVAGGSALAILDRIRPEFLGAHMTVAMSDDRYDPDVHPHTNTASPSSDESIIARVKNVVESLESKDIGVGVNNFAQMKATIFYRNASERRCEFIDTWPRPGETLEAFAERFNTALKAWRTKNPKGIVLMTQGVGPDAHTCGIMPFPEDGERFKELFEDKEKWAVGYDAKRKSEFPLRVTVTMPVLQNEVEESVVYAIGSGKLGALEKVMQKEARFNEVPAYVLRFMKKATVFTDQAIS